MTWLRNILLQFTLCVSAFGFTHGQQSNTVFLSDQLLVVGDPNYSERENTYSAVIVYQKTSQGWKMIQRVKPPEGFESDYFGESLFVSGNEIFVSDRANNRVYHYAVDKKKVKLQRIYTSLESTEVDFGKNITGNDRYILISSTQVPDAFSKSKGLVHSFKRTPSSLEFMQTFYPVGSEQTGFGNEMAILSNDEILISSNQSLKSKKQGVIYDYKLSDNGWTPTENLKAENGHRKDGFGDAFCTNETYLFVKYASKSKSGQQEIEVLKTTNNRLEKVQSLPKPTDIPSDGFAHAMSAANDKLYVSYLDKNNSFGVLIYDLNCVDEWKLVQRIVPNTKVDSVVLSIAANGQTLAIGTSRSDFNSYFDMQALSDGMVRLYEYKLDSTQIAYIEETREDFYISPSGRKHIYSHQFFDTIPTHDGCDSIIHIDLTIFKKNDDLAIDTITPLMASEIDRAEREVKNLDTVLLDNELIYFTLHDHGQFDQDTISIKLNDKWVILDEEVTKATKDFYLLGKLGINRILIRAENEGKEPPNTVTIQAYNSEQELILKKIINSDLEQSAALYIDIRQ